MSGGETAALQWPEIEEGEIGVADLQHTLQRDRALDIEYHIARADLLAGRPQATYAAVIQIGDVDDRAPYAAHRVRPETLRI